MGALDDELPTLDPAAGAAFERIRRLAMEEAPVAGERRSGGMAALVHAGRPLLGFRVARARRLAIAPFSAA